MFATVLATCVIIQHNYLASSLNPFLAFQRRAMLEGLVPYSKLPMRSTNEYPNDFVQYGQNRCPDPCHSRNYKPSMIKCVAKKQSQ
jgi:hypothetical protein